MPVATATAASVQVPPGKSSSFSLDILMPRTAQRVVDEFEDVCEQTGVTLSRRSEMIVESGGSGRDGFSHRADGWMWK